MKADLHTISRKKLFGYKDNHGNINKIAQAVIINFNDERGDIIVKNANFGTRRKYADFTESKKELGLHPYQAVFEDMGMAKANKTRYIDKEGNIQYFK